MIGMFNVPGFTGAVCVFKGGNCLRQLDFLQVLLPAERWIDRPTSRHPRT